MRVSRVGGEGREELVVWLVKFALIRACVKAGLPYRLKIPSLTLPQLVAASNEGMS